MMVHTVRDERGCEWTSEDGTATEDGVREFMYALVRLVKPQVAIETGAYTGAMTKYMARGMLLNNMPGTLDSCDTDVAFVERAQQMTGMFDFVTVHHMSGVDLIQRTTHIDFAFIDSGGDRMEEITALLPRLNSGAFVAIHDTSREDERNAVDYVMSAMPNTQQMYFPTPRGLTILRVCA